MNFKQNQHIRAKGRGIFYLLLLAAIAMSALIGACSNVSGDSTTLNLSYPAIIGTPGTAITAANPAWSSTPEGVVVYKIEPALPAGLNMELGTGIITGTPTVATEGEYTITATLADGTVKTATISITIKDISDLTDADKVAADKADLDITSAVGGDLAAVKLDFALPTTGQKGTAISWEVDSGTAISLSGTSGESAAVTRPDRSGTDDTVVLRATFTLGAVSDTKDFTLTVKKQEDLTDQQAVDQDKTALSADSFQFAQGDAHNQVTRDFTLPTVGGEGSTISWAITSGTAISLSGTNSEMAAVTRPNHGEGDANVELTATITKNSASETKTVTLTVTKKDQVDISSLDSSEFSLTVDNTSVTALIGGTHSVTVGGSLSLAAGTDYDLSITGLGFSSGAVSIADDGTITMTSAIVMSDGGDYTVTATGKGNYTGTVTDTFTLTVDAKSLTNSGLTLTVDNKTATALTEGTHSVTVGGSLTAGDDYDLSITAAGSGAVSIANNGTITIGSGIVVSDAGDYTVTATGKGNYTGTVSDDFTLTVDAKSLTDSGLSLTVTNTSVTVSTEGTHSVTVGGNLTAGDDYDLSITVAGSGAVSIANNGTITITSAIALTDTGDYTVTATGKDNYTGTVSDDFTLTVTAQPTLGEITYANGDFTLDVQITPLSPSGTNSAQAIYAMKTGESLPAGLSLAADGAISGTPTAGSPQTTYTIEATGKTGTVYAGEVKEISILISVDNDVASFFDFSLSAAQTATKDGQDETMTISIDQNARGFTAGSEYTWAITKKSDDTTPGFMTVTNNEVVITAAGIPGSSAEGTYKLTATGQGRYSGEVTKEFELDLPADAAPGAPAITGITPGDSKLEVNWSAPADMGHYDAAVGEISEYTVYWDTSSGVSKSSTTKQTVQAPTTSYEITGLANSQIYHVIVTATTAAGEGDASIPSSDTPVPDDALPGAPTITSVAPGDGKLTVSWDAPTDKGYFDGSEGVIDRYTVYWGTSSGLTTSTATGSAPAQTGTTSHEITGLTNGQTYYVIVTAATGAGTGPASTEDSGTPVPADAFPGAPTITGIVPGDGKLLVNWDAPTDKGYSNGSEGKISGYTVYWGTNSGVTTSTATDSESTDGTTSHEIDGLSNGQKYYVIVTATTGAGEGPASTAVSGTPVPADAPPGAPAISSATVGSGKVTLEWTAPASTGFINGAAGIITKYNIYYSKSTITDRTAAGVESVDVIGSDTLTTEVLNLFGATKYFFKVTAWNAAGESEASDENSATTEAVTGDTVPGAPTITATIVGGDGQVTLEWTEPTYRGYHNSTPGTIVKYTVYYDTSSIDIANQPSTKIPFSGETLTGVVPNLTNGTKYYFRVVADNGLGQGEFSNETSATPTVVTPLDAAPGAPTITTTTKGNGQITIEWEAPDDTGFTGGNGTVGIITAYTVYYGDSAFDASNLPTDKIEVSDGTLTAVVPNLINDTPYFFRVTATNAIGEGDLSDQETSTPTAAAVPNTPPGAPISVTATAGTAANITLSWTAPTDTGYINGDGTVGRITGYMVYYMNSYSRSQYDSSWGKLDTVVSVPISDGSLSTWNLPFNTVGETFSFKMTATNAFGESELSDETSATVLTPDDAPPGAPTINSATAANEAWGITLAWTAPTNTGFSNGRPDTITSYTVYYVNESTWTNGGHSWTKEAAQIRGGFSIDANSRTATVPYVGSTGDKFSFRMTATNSFGEVNFQTGSTALWQRRMTRPPERRV